MGKEWEKVRTALEIAQQDCADEGGFSVVLVAAQTALDTLQQRNAALTVACQNAKAAMKRSIDEGSTDHLDAGDDHGQFWYAALACIDTALAANGGGDV